MLRKLLVTLLSLLVVLSLTACRADNTQSSSNDQDETADTDVITYEVLRVGMECAYAPSNWEEAEATDSNLPISNNEGFYAEGYDVQIAKMVGEALGVEIEIVKLSWDGLIQALYAGTIDLIVAGMMDTKERRESIDFSDTYGVGETVYTLLVKNDSPYASAKSIQDFTSAAVLGQSGTYLDTVIDQIEGVNHIPPVSSIPNMIDRLVNDTVDAIVIDTDSAEAYLQAYDDLMMIEFDEGEGFELDYSGTCMGIRYSDEALKLAINEVLSTIDDNARQELMDWAIANMPQ